MNEQLIKHIRKLITLSNEIAISSRITLKKTQEKGLCTKPGQYCKASYLPIIKRSIGELTT